MSLSLARRVTVLLLLATIAGTPWAAAQPVRHTPRTPRVVLLWNWLTGFVLKEGCSLDPSGGTCPRPSSQPQQAGCSLDPNGCTKSPLAKEGCSLDPDGCAPAVLNLDNGCSLDPDGRCLK